MNATDTDRRTAHADCTHPTTKVARAACRRAKRTVWVPVTRDDVAKGDTIRVGDVEGTMLGWGAKRVVIRDGEGARHNVAVTDDLVVEAPGA